MHTLSISLPCCPAPSLPFPSFSDSSDIRTTRPPPTPTFADQTLFSEEHFSSSIPFLERERERERGVFDLWLMNSDLWWIKWARGAGEKGKEDSEMFFVFFFVFFDQLQISIQADCRCWLFLPRFASQKCLGSLSLFLMSSDQFRTCLQECVFFLAG